MHISFHTEPNNWLTPHEMRRRSHETEQAMAALNAELSMLRNTMPDKASPSSDSDEDLCTDHKTTRAKGSHGAVTNGVKENTQADPGSDKGQSGPVSMLTPTRIEDASPSIDSVSERFTSARMRSIFASPAQPDGGSAP